MSGNTCFTPNIQMKITHFLITIPTIFQTNISDKIKYIHNNNINFNFISVFIDTWYDPLRNVLNADKKEIRRDIRDVFVHVM